MREIKFRAWNKEICEMICWELILDDGFDKYYHDENTILEQYTGLKDKNGKEIYEGDIVCTSLSIPGEVKWGDDIACFEVVHSLGSRGLFGYIKECSGVLVIGNIHENPELLGR